MAVKAKPVPIPTMPTNAPVFVADTREQHPYDFGDDYKTIKKKLVAGDYSLEDFELLYVVERKELNDFVNTIILDKERFRNELKILQEMYGACIVVEASAQDITQHKYTSNAHPNSVWGAMESIIVDWGIPIFLMDDRQHAIKFVREWLLRQWQKYHRFQNQYQRN